MRKILVLMIAALFVVNYSANAQSNKKAAEQIANAVDPDRCYTSDNERGHLQQSSKSVTTTTTSSSGSSYNSGSRSETTSLGSSVGTSNIGMSNSINNTYSSPSSSKNNSTTTTTTTTTNYICVPDE